MTLNCLYDKIIKPHMLGFKLTALSRRIIASFKKKAGAGLMYAIIETGGKQYQVKEGDVLFIEKLEADAEASITFDKVIAVSGDNGITVGAPYVTGAAVEAKILKNGKAKKITVFTYKPKKHVKTKQGHRQPYSQVQIESIKA